MPIAAGTFIGPYEVLGWLGAGGMGEVYRARDPRLGRDVAIKLIPETFAADRGRLHRFEQEARAAGQINHPNILVVYDIGTHAGAPYIVSELLEGESLGQRLRSGALAPRKALDYARQTAEGLAAAHDKGIVHRDLKPDNLFVTNDGRIKILDFGIAKLTAPSEGAARTGLPTETAAGTVVGTAGYMSPEQVRGEDVDARSDLFSFGAILYEMLAGRAAFVQPTGAETMAAILREDPPPLGSGDVTPALARILSRCLEKPRETRFQSARDLAFGLEFLSGEHTAVTAGAPGANRGRWLHHRALPWSLAAALMLAFVSAAFWYSGPAPAPSLVNVWPPILLAEGELLDGSGGGHMVAVSPNGSHIAFVVSPFRLYLWPMNTGKIAPIPGAEQSIGVREPTFSGDNKWIAFYAFKDRTIKKMLVTGGSPVPICKADSPSGMSWAEGRIVFGQGSGGIWQCPENGGVEKQRLIKLNAGEEAHGPQMLSDDDVLFTVATGTARDRWEHAQIVVQSVKSPTRTTVIKTGTDGRYLPATGQIVYALTGSLYAAPFDPVTKVTGGSVPVETGIDLASGSNTGAAQFSVSDTGTLVYVPAPVEAWSFQMDLAFMSPTGDVQPLKLEPGQYVWPRISPDDNRIVFGNDDGKQAQVWITNTTGAIGKRALTSGSENRFPIWSSNSPRVAFQSNREDDFGIFAQNADGGPVERLTTPEPGTSHIPESWCGDTLLFDVMNGSDVTLWTKSSREKSARPFGGVHSAHPTGATFTRDCKWVAYSITEQDKTAKTSVAVQPFPATGALYVLPMKGSDTPHHPVWSLNGKELIYDPRAVGFEVASFSPSAGFGPPSSIPKKIQLGPPGTRTSFDVASDGRIVGLITSGQKEYVRGPRDKIQVIVNWFEKLKATAR